MALKMVEFDVNYLHVTATGGKSVNGLKFARYKNSDKFPRIIVYGGMKVVQGKFEIFF